MANIHEIAEKLKSEGRRKKPASTPCLLANFDLNNIEGMPAGSVVPPMTKSTDVTTKDVNELEVGHKQAGSLGSNKVADRVAIRQQLGSPLGSDRDAERKLTHEQLTSLGSNKVAHWVADNEPIRQQLGSPLGSKKLSFAEAAEAVNSLTGHKKTVLLFSFDLASQKCRNYTGQISTQILREICKTSSGTVKCAINRLASDRLIERRNGRRGNGGFVDLLIPEVVYDAIAQFKSISEPIREQLGSPLGSGNAVQLGSNKVADKVAEAPSSSSLIDLNQNFKTTTSEPELSKNTPPQHATEWQGIDTTLLAEVGFTKKHLDQIIHHGKLKRDEIEASIEFFAFDLKRNAKGKSIHGSPLNFFMGILRKGIPYAPPENYESAADEARRRTREILERKSVERQAEERRLMDLEFAEWRGGLTAPQAIVLVPDAVKDIPPAREASLRNYFDEQVYPTLAASRVAEPELERQQIRAAIMESLGEARE